MAFKKTLAQRLFSISRITTPALTNCRVASPCAAALNNNTKPNPLAPDPGDSDGIFRRYLHRQPAPAGDEVRFLPTGEKLLEKLRGMDIARNRIRLEGLMSPEKVEENKLTVADAKKILRVSQLETVKSRLRRIRSDCVTYKEFVEICGNECSSVDQGMELARMLDQSGCVIVLGNIVYLRPEKVVKAIQGLILPTPKPRDPNDPISKEFEEMERQKAIIDTKAEYLVRRELWCGLGYLLVQTAAFLRLTFWELSWDVMEPICFYVTSMYFMGGYAFFLRTSKEPSFEGFFQSRFSAKQKRLMKAHNFDVERYNELKKACCPDQSYATWERPVLFSSSVH